MGEKLAASPQTGAATASIPLPLPPARNGLQPSLALSYSSTSGQSAFGLGWGIGLPTISRLTSKGLPSYDDRRDTFVAAGAEELVAVAESEQTAFPELPWIESGRLAVRLFRPRVEGLFARIAQRKGRIRRRDGRELDVDGWEVQGKDGVTSWYGTPLRGLETAAPDARNPAVLADPAEPQRIAVWKLTRTEDLFGNSVVYEYQHAADDGAQSYIRRVRYADYGDKASPAYLSEVEWLYEDRPDHASDYRNGFEVRTTLRCRFLRTWVHPKGAAQLMQREVELVYLDELPERQEEWPANGASLLAEVHVRGKASPGAAGESLPPLLLRYSTFEPQQGRFLPVTLPEAGAEGALSPRVQFVDLDGNGLPDLLELGDGARFWANLGEGRFAPPRRLEQAPAGFELGQAGVQLLDADGDGRLDLLVQRDGLAGVFPTGELGWDRERFRPFAAAPSFDFQDPEVKLLDLDGDGVTDALRNGASFECFFQRPGAGWSEVRLTARSDVPEISFADPRVQLADMSGDGLQDLVLVTADGVRYWPNLGFGRFGDAVVMRDSPRLGSDFDPRRAVLADLDGDGLADLVYADHRGLSCWINRSGKAYSPAIAVPGTPPIEATDQLRAMDLLGTGLPGLLWAGSVDGVPDRLRFLDPCGGRKPYLLTGMDNQMGARTRLDYRPSTRDRLRDAADPRLRWRTPLPFPVQVVASVTVEDAVSGGRATSLFSYHHGYWDGTEREFRGFGRVDVRDTEDFAAFAGAQAVAAEDFMPPLETRTWYHLGPVPQGGGDWAPLDYEAEFWDEPRIGRAGMLGPLREELAARLRPLERGQRRDALRALGGQPLRSETYVLDGDFGGEPLQDRPLTVQEYAQQVVILPEPQAPGGILWLVHGGGLRETRWERGDDPMTHFRFSGEVDAWGQARLEISVAVPRGRNPLHSLPAGSPAEPYLASVQRRRYLPARGESPALPDRLAWEAGYEGRNDGREDIWTLRARLAGPVAAASHQLLSYARHYYDGDAFTGLPFGQMGATGVLIRSEQLAFTDVMLKDLSWDGGESWDETRLERPFCLKPPGSPAAGWSDATAYPASYRALFKDGYTHAGYTLRGMAEDIAGLDAEQREPLTLLTGAQFLYYVPSTRSRFDFQDPDPGKRRAARGMVLAALDPDTGTTATITYDSDYGLLPVRMEDPLGLRTEAEYDARWLQLVKLTDPHGHTRHVQLNDLGLVIASWMQSRDGSEGDTSAKPLSRLEYDLHAFRTAGSPVWVRDRERVYHALDGDVPAGADADAELVRVTWSDGFGREIQSRAQAESVAFGSGPFVDGVLPPARSAADFTPLTGTESSTRVIVSGWKRFNNKGAVVQQWEPFFDEGFTYRPPTREQLGQSVRYRLDANGQASRTLYPDGSEALHLQGVPLALDKPGEVRPTPWEATTYDTQDNGGRTHPVEHAASAAHWNTPGSVLVDALGRAVRQTVRTRDPLTGAIEERRTETALDLQGRTRFAVDELGRRTVSHEIALLDGRVVRAYDFLGRAWWVRTVDSRHPGAPAQPGTQRLVLDARGKIIEARGVKGSWSLTGLDAAHRPVEIWARDEAGAPLGLRQLLEYGDTVYGATDAKTRNALNRVVRHWDEAGLNRVDTLDFKGQVLEKTRLILKEDGFLDIFAAGTWDDLKPYRADWQDPLTRAARLGDAFTTTTAYDALGRPKRIQMPLDAESKRRVLLPSYNRAGSLERLEISDGATSETLIDRVAHNARGQRLLLLHGAGVLCRYAYDPRTQRLTRVRSERATRSGLTITPRKNDADLLEHVFQDTSYQYDLAGNPLAILEQSPDCGLPLDPHRLERRFTYDPLYRLLSATGRETDFLDITFVPKDIWEEGAPRSQDTTRARRYEEQYGYDRAGNLLSMKRGLYTRTFQPATANNRLERITVADGGTTVYDQTFDLAGNLTRQGLSRHLDWDQANRLKAFRIQAAPTSEPSVYAQHAYDAGGQRVLRLVRKQGGDWERTVSIDGVFEHVQQVKAAVTRIATHLHILDGSRRLQSFRFGDAMDDRTPAVKILLDDHLGSSIVTLDGSAQRINREEYRPYGETCFGSHAFKRFRFTGKERDEESGFQCHGARFYDPYQGRWINPDPAGSADGHNRYWYARGNPVRFSDPTGTESSEGDHPHRDAYEAKRSEMLDEAKQIGGTSSLQIRAEKGRGKGGAKKFNPIAWLENQESWGDLGQKYKNMFVEGLQESLQNGSSPYTNLFSSNEFTDVSNQIFKIFRKGNRSKLENQFVKEYVSGIERDAKAIIRVFTDQMVKKYGDIPIPGKTKVGPGFPEMSGAAAGDMRRLLAAARDAGFDNKELAFGSIRGIHEQGSRYAEFLKRGFIDGDLAGAVIGTIIWPGKMSGDNPNQLKHATGRAVDFSILYTGGKGSTEAEIQSRYDRLRDRGKERAYELHVWLVQNAHQFGFHPIDNEPWHWEHDPGVKYNADRYLARDRFEKGGFPPEWMFLLKSWANWLFYGNRFFGPGF